MLYNNKVPMVTIHEKVKSVIGLCNIFIIPLSRTPHYWFQVAKIIIFFLFERKLS